MKIYNEVILQWNDKTGQFDTVHEDYYYHDGPIDKLAERNISAEEARETRDVLDEINDDIKRNKKGTEEWSQAQQKLNNNLSTVLNSLAEQGKVYDKLRTQVSGLREGTMDLVDLERDLHNQRADLAKQLEEHKAAQEAYEKAKASGDMNELKAAREKYAEQRNLVRELEDGVEGTENLVALSKDYEKAQARAAAMTKLDNDLLGGMGQEVMDLVKNFGSVLGVIGLIGMVIAGVSAITQDIGDNFGALGISGAYDNLVDLRSEAVFLGYEFSEAAQAVGTLSTELGIGTNNAAKLAVDTLDTAKALGMGVTETASLQAMIANVTSTSAEGANNFMKQAAALAQANNVAPHDVLNDMAEASDDIASFTDDTGDNMVRAAVRAKQLGMSLSSVAGIARGLLDFQTSLSNEMTASAMLGKNLNLQKARELALAGDLVGMTDEILNNVVSEAEWASMNVLEREALADAIGVSSSQMSRLVKEAGKSTKEISSMRKMGVGELVGKKAMSRLNQVVNWFKWLGSVALGAVAKWLDKMDWFGMSTGMEGADEIVSDWVNNKLNALHSWWVMAKDEIGKMATAIKDAAKWLGEWFMWMASNETLLKTLAGLWILNKTGITGFVQAGMTALGTYIARLWAARAAQEAVEKGPDLSKSAGGGSAAANMIAGAFAILILAGAMWVLGLAFQNFAGVEWPQVLFGLGAIAVLAGIAALLAGVSGPIMIGAAAVLVLAAAVLVLGFAFILFGIGGMLFIPFLQAMALWGAQAALNIGLLAIAMLALTPSLFAFGFAGLFATPAMNKVIEFDKQMHGQLERADKKKIDPAVMATLMVGAKTVKAIDLLKKEVNKMMRGFGNTNPEDNEYNKKNAQAITGVTIKVKEQ